MPLACIAAWITSCNTTWLRAALVALLPLACTALVAAPQPVPLYTQYPDPPLDAASPGNLTAKLAAWLSERSDGRYQFVATPLPRGRLDALLARPGWQGAVAWAHPRWFGDETRSRFLWSEPFVQDADLVVSRRQRPVEFLNGGRSLEGLRVGVVHGHRLPDLDWMLNQGLVHRVDVDSEMAGLRELQAGRLDAVFVQAISMPQFRRALPQLDSWLHVAKQPRDTFWRHFFTDRHQPALHAFLNQQLPALRADPQWRSQLPQQPRQIRLVVVDRLDSPYAQSLRKLLDRLFEEAGLRYALSMLPAERALLELKAGRFDGDAVRATSFAEHLGGALRVEPSHSQILHLALVRAGDARPSRWADLAGLSFALPRGLKLAEEMTRDMKGRQLVESADACVRMLSIARVAACVLPGFGSSDWTGREKGVRLVAQVLGSSPTHLWLRPGLDEEARRLSAAMLALERSGELARLMGAYRSVAASAP